MRSLCAVAQAMISIHALREEGDCACICMANSCCIFLSTPSARRATGRPIMTATDCMISIHALREEGDHNISFAGAKAAEFLSTPSARRATSRPLKGGCLWLHFYPRPPRGGRQ